MNINNSTGNNNYTFIMQENGCRKQECTLYPVTEGLMIKIKDVNPAQFILNSNAEAEFIIKNSHEFIEKSLVIFEGVTMDEVPSSYIVVNHVAQQIIGDATISIINCTDRLVTLNEDRRLIIDNKPQDVLLPSSDHTFFVWEDRRNLHIVRENKANEQLMYSSNQRSTGERLHL